jgi:DNA polymerase-3 subunit gamma/tau
MNDAPDTPGSLFGSPDAQAPEYRVLARKYRPTTFRDMIGQDALVRTLTNAITGGRLAHAFILTGVRGVGKTTTARIIARALNCVGPDGKGGPTPDPCGVCDNCRAIAEDRHVDVLEMDAASRTGVADIRELIDGVRYRPVQARYKVYIIDEVHMLSTSAFNALLKTLEEPPEHVKFVFATTEIRKVPVTVLSRCQRFDLRRIDAETLAAYFATLADKEGAKVAPAALALIARAADGSARDGLSLLDQAMALAEGEVGETQVRAMLGLADRTQLFDLFERLMRGEAAASLDQFARMYEAGADPSVVMQDLLDLTHWITRVKVAPQAADQPTVPEAERVRGRDLAGRLSVGVLTRTWQMLLKGLSEVQTAPLPLQAAEMVMIRLTHAAALPSPAELVAQIAGGDAGAPGGNNGSGRAGARGGAAADAIASPGPGGTASDPRAPRAMIAGGEGTSVAAPDFEAPLPVAAETPAPQSFAEMVALFAARREGILHAHLVRDVHAVRFEPGRIEFRPAAQAPRDLANRIGQKLGEWTGRRWVIAVSAEPGQPTIAEQQAEARRRERETVSRHPLVQAVLTHFPGATIEAIRDLAAPVPAPAGIPAEAEPGDAAETGDFAVPDEPLSGDPAPNDVSDGDDAP